MVEHTYQCFFDGDNIAIITIEKYKQKPFNEKTKLICGEDITRDGGPLWTVPELLFNTRKLIPALQQLLTEDKMSDLQFR